MNLKLASVAAVSLGAALSFAGPLVFTGTDIAAGLGAFPNSRYSNSEWFGVASGNNSVSTINFENMGAGTMVPFSPKAGVTLSSTGSWDYLGVDNNQTPDTGRNTTFGGSKYLRAWEPFDNENSSVTFNFAHPISSFGFFLSGLQDNAVGKWSVSWNASDGFHSYDFAKHAPGTNGEAAMDFFGVVDDPSFTGTTSVTISVLGTTSTRDLVGIDDFSFTNCEVVPEPGTWAALGLGAVAVLRRRRSK